MVLSIGHRGFSGRYPENTLLSFLKAKEAGADMVELDVHICRTGELVVIHDDTVDRTTDGTGKISDMDLSEIRKLDAGSGEMIPLLSEVLELLKGHCELNIELKGKGTGKVLGCYLDGDVNDILVSSFLPDELYEFHMQKPDVRIGYLIDSDPRGAEEFVKELGGFSVHPRYDLCSDKFTARCHYLGLKVFVWTVNDEKDVERMVRMGVDGVITDHLDLLK